MHGRLVVVDRIVVPDHERVTDGLPERLPCATGDPRRHDGVARPEDQNSRVQLARDRVEVSPVARFSGIAPIDRWAEDHPGARIGQSKPSDQRIDQPALSGGVDPLAHVVE